MPGSSFLADLAELERAALLVKRTALLGKRYHALKGRIGPMKAPAAAVLLEQAGAVLIQLLEGARELPERGSWGVTLPKLEGLIEQGEMLVVQLEACRVS